MAKYKVETDNGTYEVETEDEGTPQWSDLPGNAAEGLKEAPQMALGLANMAKQGLDLTSPVSLAKSGAQALTGTPVGETDTGEAAKGAAEGVKGTVDSLKSLPGKMAEFAKHPGQSIKEHIIEHPVSSAVDAASLLLPGSKAALDTGAKYAGRFGENQMGRLHDMASGQFRKAGKKHFGPTMRASYKHGDADFTRGSIGRDEAIDKRVEDFGADLGKVREEGSTIGKQRTPKEMADEIRRQALQDFQPGGTKFKHAAAFEENVGNIEKMPSGGIKSFADRATAINKEASDNRLVRSTNAETDIADLMARINDDDLAAKLGPERAKKYGALKKDFSLAKNLQKIDDLNEGKDRLAKIPNTAIGIVKSIASPLDVGTKLGAKLGFGAEAGLQNVSKNAGAYAAAGLTTNLVHRLQNNPQSFGKYAAPLQQAQQEGGPQSVAAMHYVLSSQYPDYNQMSQLAEDENKQ